jgi:2-oxoglutarate dehydrogenase E1 component
VIPEHAELVPGDRVKRVVLCTGKVYYDLLAERDSRGLRDVAIIRVEQLYPFPFDALGREMIKYPNADIVWCQEEPANMGYWTFVDHRIERTLGDLPVKRKQLAYAGRPEAASPATGLLKRHNLEQAQLIDDALMVK